MKRSAETKEEVVGKKGKMDLEPIVEVGKGVVWEDMEDYETTLVSGSDEEETEGMDSGKENICPNCFYVFSDTEEDI